MGHRGLKYSRYWSNTTRPSIYPAIVFSIYNLNICWMHTIFENFSMVIVSFSCSEAHLLHQLIVTFRDGFLCTNSYRGSTERLSYKRSTLGCETTLYRDDDFPRSRKTDGKRGINHWKRKTYFQTEKHINVLLTTCCTEICNKSYQIQRMSHLFTY